MNDKLYFKTLAHAGNLAHVQICDREHGFAKLVKHFLQFQSETRLRAQYKRLFRQRHVPRPEN